MDKPIYFTICSLNYMAYALTLGRSLTDVDPDARFVIFLADRTPSDKERELAGFELVDVSQLDLPTLQDMTLRYSVMEFNTAIKPTCFQYAFKELGASSAVYLDPDILALRPLSHVESALAGGAGLVLTPHTLFPLDDGGDPDDLRVLRTGCYNLGFAAFTDTPETADFLEWWKARLAADCRVALDDGIFVDQKWMDLGPCYVPATHILRHPGYNAAYWNLHRRPITHEYGGWRAAGEDLHFFHFSGLDPMDGSIFSKHQSRYSIDQVGDLAELHGLYIQMLHANGHAHWRAVPYGFNQDGRGQELGSLMRAVYQRAHPEPVDDPSDIMADLEVLCNAPSKLVPSHAGGVITNLTYEIWACRPDLRRTFDISTSDGRSAFNGWLLSSGVTEHRLDSRYLNHLGVVTLEPEQTGADDSSARLLYRLVRHRHLARPMFKMLPASLQERVLRRVNRALDRAAPPPPEMANEAPADADRDQALAEPRELDRHAVSVYGYFATESGVGEGARRTFRALRSVGCPVTPRLVTTRGAFQDKIRFEAPFQSGPSAAGTHLFQINADQTVLASRLFDESTFDPEHLRIGYWAWELDKFPEIWRPALDMLDEIWTPSCFVRDVVQSVTDKPVHVMPHPTPAPAPVSLEDRRMGRRRFALPRGMTLFLTAFDFNSYAERKNPGAALEAFDRAIEKTGDIGLVIKCHGSASHDRRRFELLEEARRRSNIFLVDRVLSEEELDALYAACDGLISLHRSEGFGMTMAEAMSRGMPVIATNYSGNTDFVDETVGVPVPYELVPVPEGAYPHWEGARWAEPDIEAAGAAMARLAQDSALRAELGAAARRRMIENFSYEVVGRRMLARLDEVRALREGKAKSAA